MDDDHFYKKIQKIIREGLVSVSCNHDTRKLRRKKKKKHKNRLHDLPLNQRMGRDAWYNEDQQDDDDNDDDDDFQQQL